MRILVTGAAGFIGSRVCERLLDHGHDVVGADNRNTAYDPRLKDARLARLEGRERFRFVPLDVTEWEPVRELFAQEDASGGFDAAINLAARAGVRPSVENPWVYYRTNAEGTLNLLEGCRRHGVGKLVLASTSSVYGGNPTPFHEDADTSRPLSPYAASKKAAEALCHTYHHLYGLDVTVPRYFTVYGPAGRPDMSVFRFIRWIAEGEPLTLTGDGRQQRDFSYVDDIAEGTVAALGPVGFRTVNLGSDRPVSIGHVIETLERLIGRKAEVRRAPAHPADVPATWADIGRARSLLGWEPSTPLETGLRRTVQWYFDNREWASAIELPG